VLLKNIARWFVASLRAVSFMSPMDPNEHHGADLGRLLADKPELDSSFLLTNRVIVMHEFWTCNISCDGERWEPIMSSFGLFLTVSSSCVSTCTKSSASENIRSTFLLLFYGMWSYHSPVLNLKKALQSNDLPTEFVKWREMAADRNQWRAICDSKMPSATKETPTSSRHDI
jgi:hypothetical protein